jgi:tetratricopeptide (TPR) repeat protein
MPDMHLSRDLLDAVVEQRLPPKIVLELIQEHLMALCPHCRTEIEAYRAGRAATPSAVISTLTLLTEQLESLTPEVERAEVEAEHWIAELLALPAEERLPRVEQARKRYRGAAFAARLLRGAKDCLPGEVDLSLQLAEIAERVALRSPIDHGRQADLLTEALARQANAHRALGQLRHAEQTFASARARARIGGVTDSRLCAVLDDLEGSLRKDQRHSAEAEKLLSRAGLFYRLAEDPRSAAKVEIKRGLNHFYANRIHQAIESTFLALGALDPETEPRLYLLARLNLAEFNLSHNDPLQALDFLEYDEDLIDEHADAVTQMRVTWLKARIWGALGKPKQAQAMLLAVREFFIQRQNGFDVATVCLDLALLYLERGRWRDVRRMASEAVELFAAQAVHPEALAALWLFEQAAQRQDLETTWLQRLSAYLQHARVDPEARFGG